MSDAANASSPATIAVASGLAALAGGIMGAVAAIYARGRSDGARDASHDLHGKQLSEVTNRVSDLEKRSAEHEKSHAVLVERVTTSIERTQEVLEIVRRLETKERR
jgi:hypothetical protein